MKIRKRILNYQSIIINNKNIAISFALIIPLFLYNFTKLKMVNFDHLLFNNYTFSDLIHKIYSFGVMQQSRPRFLVPITTAIEYINIPYWIWVILYILLMGLLIGLIVNQITSNKYVGLGASFLSICFYTITLEPISMPSAYAFSQGSGIILLLASIYFIVKYNKYDKYKYKIYSVICILLCLFDYEIGILYIPVLIALNVWYKPNVIIKDQFKRSKEFIYVGILYLVATILIKSIYIGSYEGTQIHSFNLTRILYSLGFMLIATIPGFSLFYDGSNAYKSPITIINSNQLQIDAFTVFSDIVQILLFILLIILLNKKIVQKKDLSIENKSIRRNLPLFLLGAYCIIIPIVPSSLTDYTQGQIESRWRLLGICNQYSYCFMIITICVWLYFIHFKNKSIKKLVIISFCFIMTLQFSFTIITNQVNSKIIETEGTRFEQFDLIIDDISYNINDNSIIYAPSLYSGGSPLSLPPFYFTDRIKFLTQKNITVVPEYPQAESIKGSFYYLRYIYSSDEKYTLFLLSKVNYEDFSQYIVSNNLKSDALPISDNATIYCFSKEKECNMIGKLNDDKVEININSSKISTNYFLNYQLKQSMNKYNKVTLNTKADNIYLNSIAILPNYYSSPYSNEIIS